MSLQDELKIILQQTLQLDDVINWQKHSEMLGAVPEFDSMAIVTVLTQIEENYGIFIEDDEISAETFATLGSLELFIEEKIAG